MNTLINLNLIIHTVIRILTLQTNSLTSVFQQSFHENVHSVVCTVPLVADHFAVYDEYIVFIRVHDLLLQLSGPDRGGEIDFPGC